MRKVFMLLLSLFVFLAIYMLEGGRLHALVGISAVFPLTGGVLFTALFTFEFKELLSAFKEAFSAGSSIDKVKDYHLSLLVVKNLQTATLFWSVTILIVASILILSHLRNPYELGSMFAVAFLSLLYGFGGRALLLTPMEMSLRKKLLQVNDSEQ